MKKEKRESSGKISYGIWLLLMAKRLLKRPLFLLLLLSVPLLGLAAAHLEREESGAVAAVCVEEGEWKTRIEGSLREEGGTEGGQLVFGEGSVVSYVFYDTAEAVERAVARQDADCGLFVPQGIEQRVMEGDWRGSITLYETSGSRLTGIVKEQFAGVLFQLYSETMYEEYMANLAETMTGEFAAYARAAYEKRLTDGSTFSFVYRKLPDGGDLGSQDIYDTNVINDISVFPVKGVFSVLIFISGLCGMLEYEKDKKEKRFLRIAPNWVTYIVNIWLPVFLTSLAVLPCLWVNDFIRYGAMGNVIGIWNFAAWIRQIRNLVVYQFILVSYCCIIKIALRRQETVAAAIPILALGSLVCCPVFLRLAMYVPVFGVLEKLFPATYYLML